MDNTVLFGEAADLVRARDRNRYLTARFAPPTVRADLLTLYAFNCELDRIPRLVSEAMLGDIRLQWWRDALDKDSRADTTGNLLADGLSDMIVRHKLSKAILQGMIDARSADLVGGGFQDWQAFRAYLYKSDGAVFALSAQLLGMAYEDALKASNSAAVAYGIADRLQMLPADCAAGRVMLPLSMLDDAGVTVEQLLAGEGGAGLKSTVSQLADYARDALTEVREQVSALPDAARPAFAPLATVAPLLGELESPGIRLLHDVVEINPLRQFWRIWRASRTGRF